MQPKDLGMDIATILVVEDDPDIQKVIRMSLKFRGVRQVVVASDGDECLAIVNKVRPDLILMDVNMPRRDGYDTCRMLKANPDTQGIPVMFLTAKAQQSDQDMGFDAGALGYLTKPFDPMTLYDKILEILDEKKVANNS